jgi:hypothetical protein
MKKLKDFFSPVKGGGHDGLKFGKWFMHMQRAGLISIFILVMSTLGLISPIEEWDPQWTFVAVEIALGLILTLITFKTLQNWNDMKNHTSR